MDIMETTRYYHLYWYGIRNAIQKESQKIVILTNIQNLKYGKLSAKVVEEISRNKLYVYLMDHMNLKNTYIGYCKKGKKYI